MPLKDDLWRLAPAGYGWETILQTRYGDMDWNRHLNNVALARLFEEARVRFHQSLRDSGASPEGVMIVHAAIDYLAEGAHPADVVAAVAVPRVGRTSYRLAIGLFQGGAALALADCVMVSATGGAATPVPDRLRAAISAFQPREAVGE
jgi:acyl-CoA thioester hydrolase